MKILNNDMYLLLIDEEAEIKEGSYYITNLGNIYKETERPFEEDEGVERFSNRSLYKSVIAYYPLNSEAKELDLPLLPNPFKDYSLDKAIEFATSRFQKNFNKFPRGGKLSNKVIKDVIEASVHTGYKFASKANKQFTLDEMKRAIEMAREIKDNGDIFDIDSIRGLTEVCTYDWEERYSEEEIIQSLSTQQLPNKFIPEYTNKVIEDLIDMNGNYNGDEFQELKTITNSEGKEELVGTYR